MKERIKQLRKSLALTQREFGDRIGVKSNTIATYEIGRNVPIDAVVSLICREFNVNEEWLRTGSGEMFKQTEESAVSRLCAELHASELEAGIIRAYFKIDPKIRDTFMRRLLEEVQAEQTVANPSPVVELTKSSPADSEAAKQAELEREVDQEVERYRQQLLSEKRRASQASTVKESGVG